MILSLTVLLLDQATKAWAQHALSDIVSLPVIPGFFHLTLVHNSGVAFGLFQDQSLLVFCGVLVILGGLFWVILRKQALRRGAAAGSLGLILGGALGNLIDRIRFGGVVDFLDFQVWPVFNLADSCITVGAVWLGWNILKSQRSVSA